MNTGSRRKRVQPRWVIQSPPNTLLPYWFLGISSQSSRNLVSQSCIKTAEPRTKELPRICGLLFLPVNWWVRHFISAALLLLPAPWKLNSLSDTSVNSSTLRLGSWRKFKEVHFSYLNVAHDVQSRCLFVLWEGWESQGARVGTLSWCVMRSSPLGCHCGDAAVRPVPQRWRHCPSRRMCRGVAGSRWGCYW